MAGTDWRGWVGWVAKRLSPFRNAKKDRVDKGFDKVYLRTYESQRGQCFCVFLLAGRAFSPHRVPSVETQPFF